ncbi:MAG: hypothetical protein GTN84_15820 [Hydrogenophaga sp.]|uniref:hypothetical protein n=1 Tax=Hydrogenophaga sp. TaxID=1904254 RepID=UPI00169B1F5C|nr:hypothetical protein [Hydrogenophaga sp.]NIM42845.1 hypothetical protein [Hydrogenophaga sp.]NIN27778.1 hypothetical protein [Hydrogenophaga sp.]NIN32597.1 hypothetical protein [Hydrogenophaga sp.]NIN57051.1 hypothetical protein [Hydrogenophaga sp.]NIO53462.1 hypothetical protein [Hydrogenophaga sp.]
MAVDTIFSFLTYPRRNRPEEPLAPGVQIPIANDKLCSMLGGVFNNAGNDCVVPVIFSSDDAQVNPVRDELLALVARPNLRTATPLAARLQLSTSGQSGMGLLFICLGDDGGRRRVVLSRFPADEGIVAERNAAQLTVQFVEQVFLKSAYSYKAATYVATGRADQLWSGHIVDRQINAGSKAVADYWIIDFLKSDFATTAAAGTKRLANAMKDAIASVTSVEVKTQIAAAAQLAGNLPARTMSISDFCDRFGFAPETKEAVLSKVKPSRLVNERFRFDAGEFASHIKYKQVELDNGAVLTAPADRFEDVFQATQRRGHGAQHTFSTTGLVIDERLKKTK